MRAPDEVITTGNMTTPYIRRWVLARFLGCQLALHQQLRSDDDRALHDHVGWNVSLILKGGYIEYFQSGWCMRNPGALVLRRARTLHRLELPMRNGVISCSWSLWLRGPKRRDWGFMTKQLGWVQWERYHQIFGERFR
jgi:hypothetical protein